MVILFLKKSNETQDSFVMKQNKYLKFRVLNLESKIGVENTCLASVRLWVQSPVLPNQSKPK
jgi:hypothetical protein